MRNSIVFHVCSWLALAALPACVTESSGQGTETEGQSPAAEIQGPVADVQLPAPEVEVPVVETQTPQDSQTPGSEEEIPETEVPTASVASGQVHGSFEKGSLVNATALPSEGPGFVHLFHDARQRFYGSKDLVELLQSVAADIAARFPEGERLQIGDLSLQNGGVIPSQFGHQNGLDADFIYFRKNHAEQEPAQDRRFLEHFARDKGVSPNFDTPRNWELMRSLVASGKISRIFVDISIKQELCRYKATDNSAETIEVLRRLRGMGGWLFSTHAAVRLNCPKDSPACEAQRDLPKGPDCPGR